MQRRKFFTQTALASSSMLLAGCNTSRSAINLPSSNIQTIRPAALQAGDRVHMIAPGSGTSIDRIQEAVVRLESLGLKVHLGKYVTEVNDFLAGTDEERLHDIHTAFSDKEAKGVWALRGGYGCTRLLPHINYNIIRTNPKVLVGYSDITALLQAIYLETGLIGFHGPVGTSELTPFALGEIEAVLFGDRAKGHIIQTPQPVMTLHKGKGKGVLVGGNLSLLAAMAGTPYQIDASNKLVCLEDVGESPYRIDRMLTTLRQSMNLQQSAGILLGEFNDCGEFDKLKAVLVDRLADLGVPVAWGFPFGHGELNMIIPIGVEAELNADTGILRLLDAAVVG